MTARSDLLTRSGAVERLINELAEAVANEGLELHRIVLLGDNPRPTVTINVLTGPVAVQVAQNPVCAAIAAATISHPGVTLRKAKNAR